MATLTFTFDTGNVPLNKIVDAFAVHFNYQSTIDGQPNPETKAQFAKRMTGNWIKSIVFSTDIKAAEEAARSSVSAVEIS